RRPVPDVNVEMTQAINGWVAEVTVTAGDSRTKHRVTLSQPIYLALTRGRSSPEHLIRESFAFLLELETNESILREFDLTRISDFFPTFERDIKERLGSQ
ncbi:MAG: hypothetical protein WD533_03860, partial [Dehalococcoidia bacterium]